MTPPPTDPTPIFELFRGAYATELLTAAATRFDLFNRLAQEPLSLAELQEALGLQRRPTIVLTTALRAFGLLESEEDKLALSPLARNHLTRASEFDVTGYLGLAANSPGVKEMVKRLETNVPAAASSRPDDGAAFIYREGLDSAMEKEAGARALTLSLAGRAMNVAPALANAVSLERARVLLDVGAGSGLYSIALLKKYPQLRAIAWDRPEVLRVAEEMAAAHDVSERLDCVPGDMFADPPPGQPDTILLSNVLHDWDEPESLSLVSRCAEALPANGRLLVHDVFLNDALDGPLPVALYSAALFTLTRGRAYSMAELASWLRQAGLEPAPGIPTLVHCAVVQAAKSPQ